jgi:hypothetical protein
LESRQRTSHAIPAVTQTSPLSIVKAQGSPPRPTFKCCSDPASQSPDGKAPSLQLQLQSPPSSRVHPQPSSQSPGLKRTLTATIPSPHSLAAILSPSAPPEGASRSTSPKRTHEEAFSADRQPFLHPASPSQHHRTSVASTAPVPGTHGTDEGASGVMTGGQEEKKPQKMVRSSIACARCRRSKVKCKPARSDRMAIS